jgi:hypothetical protein
MQEVNTKLNYLKNLNHSTRMFENIPRQKYLAIPIIRNKDNVLWSNFSETAYAFADFFRICLLIRLNCIAA